MPYAIALGLKNALRETFEFYSIEPQVKKGARRRPRKLQEQIPEPINLEHAADRARRRFTAQATARPTLELVLIGAYGNLKPTDPDFVNWKTTGSELGFTRFRKRLRAALRSNQCKWLVADNEFPDKTFRELCDFTHSRSTSSNGAIWRSNGPIYAHDALMLTFLTAVSVYAISYLFVRIARPNFTLPRDSRLLFEEAWVPNREGIKRAFEELYKEHPVSRMT